MSFLSAIPVLGTLLDRVTNRLLPDRSKVAENQSVINQAELSGAPASRLRLWRSFLGWVLSLAFAWEVAVRPVISTYWPDARLPPSVLGEVSRILLGMLGLGF